MKTFISLLRSKIEKIVNDIPKKWNYALIIVESIFDFQQYIIRFDDDSLSNQNDT